LKKSNFESKWQITWHKNIKNEYKDYPHKKHFKTIIEKISINPYHDVNIKKLQGNLQGLYRYRKGNFRLIYRILDKTREIRLLSFASRGNIY